MEINFDFKTEYVQANPSPWKIQIQKGKLTDDRIEDVRLSQALNDVTADFEADETKLTIKQLNARNGDTSVKLAAERHGYSPNAPLSIWLEAKHLYVDRKWEKSLPPALLEGLQKFQPAGFVDIIGRASFDGTNWKADGQLTCQNISFTYHKFPYRLDRTQGTLDLRNNHLSGKLTSFASGKPIEINCEIDNPGSNFTGFTNISGQNISLDQNLMFALPERHREVLTSLQPAGSINFVMRVAEESPHNELPKIDLKIDLNKCSAKFQKFAYRIDDIIGSIELHNDIWSFNNLTGINDNGQIAARGSVVPFENGKKLDMSITGTSIPLDDELRDSLPAQAQKFWTAIHPSGAIDIVAHASYLSTQHKFDLTIEATPHLQKAFATANAPINSVQSEPASTLLNGMQLARILQLDDKLKLQRSTVTIDPAFLPLRFENVLGKLIYRSGKIEFQDVHAEYERLPIVADGFIEYDDTGAWHTHFNKLILDRLRLERPNIQAALRRSFAK